MKTVLITGSTRGIGWACAQQLAQAGMTVVICGRDLTRAQARVDELQSLGLSARALAFDVTDRVGTSSVLEADIAEHGAYWGVVLNAGIHDDAPLVSMTENSWDSVIDTNLNAFFNTLKPVTMPMARKKAGRIVVISSISGIIGTRGQTNYSAAKAGLIGAAKALGAELASRGITVNVVAPGLIQTEMVSEENIERITPMIPMRRMGQPEEVAGVVTFLMSDAASYVTRAVIPVSGGLD